MTLIMTWFKTLLTTVREQEDYLTRDDAELGQTIFFYSSYLVCQSVSYNPSAALTRLDCDEAVIDSFLLVQR